MTQKLWSDNRYMHPLFVVMELDFVLKIILYFRNRKKLL